MDENVNKSPDQGKKYENSIVPSAASVTPLNSNASESKLRVVWCDSRLRDVWSPKLNVSEGVAADSARSSTDERTAASSTETEQNGRAERAAEPASHPILPRSFRLAMLAGPLAAAAALGAIVGCLSAGSVAHFWPHSALSSSNVAAWGSAQATKTELAELTALKASLEGALYKLNNQLAKLAERLDRMERAGLDLHAKLAHVAEAVDRLEKARENVMASNAAPAAAEITGTIPNPLAKPEPPENVMSDWILHAVRGSHALVENRDGVVFEITSGSTVPGLGRVEAIKRQDGHWVVVTARGLITSAR